MRSSVAISVLEHSYKGQIGKQETLSEILSYANTAQEHGTPIDTIPTVNGKPLDLVKLSTCVLSRGGFSKISDNKQWNIIMKEMKIFIPIYEIQKYYEMYITVYEKWILYGKRGKVFENENCNETTASIEQIQKAQNIAPTTIPFGSKRLKMQMYQHSNLTVLHKMVLALDSNISDQVSWALNQMTVLSYGSGYDDENILYIAKVPAMLDALSRQIQHYLQEGNEAVIEQTRILGLVHVTAHYAERHVMDGKILLVLNIVRNLVYTARNQKPVGTHAMFPTLCIQLLKSDNMEIVAHVFDVLSCIASYLCTGDDATEQVPASTAVPITMERHAHVQSNSQIAKQMHLSTSFAMHLSKSILSNDRNTVLRSIESFSALAQLPLLSDFFTSTLPTTVYARIVECLALQKYGSDALSDDTKKKEDVSEEPTSTDNESTTWPSPWASEAEGYKSNTASSTVFGLSDDALDTEVRDIALEALYHFSSLGPALKLKLCALKHCLPRLACILVSRVGRPEAARMSAGTLTNLSMHRSTFPYFLSIERPLVLVAATDENVTDLLSNVLSDVYGMHSLPPSKPATQHTTTV